ncbi:MAG: HAD family hydrolase [Rubrobacteraceae bacterium]
MNRKNGGAVVFDCDGLLLDTEKCWTRGESALFAAHGEALTPEHKRNLVGASGKRAARYICGVLGLPGREDEILEELITLSWPEVAGGARPMPGAEELVRELHGKRPLGVASNSPRELVKEALSRSGLGGAFDIVLGSDDVSNPKPDPELYRTACERLGAEPERSVALEDSPPGVEAARAAGMYVIGVPSEEGVELGAADIVARSLGDPSVLAAIQ